MTYSLKLVKEFHDAFGVPVKTEPDLSDAFINKSRIDLLQEELDELKEAIAGQDKVKTLDALLDIQYVLDGAFLALGYTNMKQAGIEEVHRSNMSKLDEFGKPILKDGKAVKGPSYTAPDLIKIMENISHG